MQAAADATTVRNRSVDSISNETQISVSNAGKFYGDETFGVAALQDVSLSIQRNEFFTLLGPSGCGKSTLLRILGGFEDLTSGEILLEGSEILTLPARERPINTVFQNYALFPHMTVRDNVSFGLKMRGDSSDQIQSRVKEVLALVQLVQLADRMPSQLSGGQQQRVALARALAPHPKVLLLDEPLSALDLKLRKDMQIEMKRIQRESSSTFVFVTHDQEEALTMSDRIAVISDGQLQQVGTPNEIYFRPTNRFVADFIGEMNFLEAEAIDDGDANTQTFKLFGTGQEISVEAEGENISIGKSVTLAIRPESCLLEEDSKSSVENTLIGSLERLIFAGPHTVAEVGIGGGNTVKVRLKSLNAAIQDSKLGDKLHVQLPSKNIVVLTS